MVLVRCSTFCLLLPTLVYRCGLCLCSTVAVDCLVGKVPLFALLAGKDLDLSLVAQLDFATSRRKENTQQTVFIIVILTTVCEFHVSSGSSQRYFCSSAKAGIDAEAPMRHTLLR